MTEVKERQRVNSKRIVTRSLLCMVAAGEEAGLWYFIKMLQGSYTYPLVRVLLIFLTITGLLLICKPLRIKGIAALAILLCLLSVAIPALVFCSTEQKPLPATKEELFARKKVLLLVPHQDDEINVLGGAIEEYTKYGSELWIVYTTNGDFEKQQEKRIQETIRSMKLLGVEEDHIILLGYGDGWKDKHIYHGEKDETVTSFAGRTETYALDPIPAFREGNAYTRENFHNDIKDVILAFSPDILICVDYDLHTDHRALSLAFDRVMGEILKETDYKPIVLKGFAYSTAWFSAEDLYQEKNIQSTKNINGLPYMAETHIFQWNDRLRLPIAAESLCDKAYNGRLMKALTSFVTQKAAMNAGSVINGDKVLWQRTSDSLSYQAKVTASSGEAALLNDFMLLESSNIKGMEKPFEGTWIPDQTDTEKQAELQLNEPGWVESIVLYDNPSLEDNVLRVRIILNDSETLEAGPLIPNGAGTRIQIKRDQIQKIAVQLLSEEGEKAGLTEIEILEKEKENPFSFIKLMDTEENFAYRYKITEDNQSFAVYSPRSGFALTEEDFTVESSNPKTKAEIQEGEIQVFCPKGEKTEITVKHKASGLSDTIQVIHMNQWQNLWAEWTILCNNSYRKCVEEQMYRFDIVPGESFHKGLRILIQSNIF